MAGRSVINVLINGDTRGLRKSLDEATSNIGSFAAGVAKKMALAGTAIAGVSAVIGKQAIDAASDLNEVASKVEVVFGDAADEVKAFAKTAASTLGQSQTAALEAASTFGVFGKAAGLTGPYLGKFSTDLAGLASDLASFGNTTPEEAAQALGAALRGESEPIRRYGVMLDDAALKAKALEMGIYDGKGALTQQQKILAATASIYAQTTDAQGDFVRTSGGAANQQRILAAQFENVKASIGQQLLPAFTSALKFINDRVLPGVERLVAVFDKGGLGGVVDLVAAQLPALKAKLAEWGKAIVDWIGPRIGPMLAKLAEWGRQLGNWLITTGLPFVVDKLQQLGQALIDWIGPRIKPTLKKLGEFIASAANWILDVGLPMLVDKLIVLGNALVDWIQPRIVPMLTELGKVLIAILQWIVTKAVPKIAEQAVKLSAALLGWVARLLPEVLEGLGRFVVDLVKKIPGLFVSLIRTFAETGRAMGQALMDSIMELLSGLGRKASVFGKQLVDALIDFINVSIIDRLNDLLEFEISVFGAKVKIDPPDIGRIPKMADGGIVTRPTLAVVGEAGPEAVVPLSQYRGAGNQNATINLTVNAGMGTDGAAVGRQIVQELLKFQRQNGALPFKVA
jgi:hypothetical protein